MAEAWLKVRHSLLRSAKVRALMRELRCKKHAALGLAVAWLVWIDEQTTDGQTHLLPDELDDEIGFRGCAEALISIGWAALGEDGCVYALEFGKHCGDSAKERAQGARRVERHRNKQGAKNGNAECNAECNGESVTKTLPDKNRKEYIGNEYPIESINTVYGGEAAGDSRYEGRYPESTDTVLSYMASLPNCTLRGEELLTCAETFFNQSEAVGWTINGQPVRDWRASARAFLAKWQNNIFNRGSAVPRGKVTYRSETKQNYDL